MATHYTNIDALAIELCWLESMIMMTTIYFSELSSEFFRSFLWTGQPCMGYLA